MLSSFKSKSKPEPATLTLKARVRQFWKWYVEVAPRFHETIERKRCADLEPEVMAKVDEMLPKFAWVFGPGEQAGEHSFTLSGDGILHRQLITRYWLSQAPVIPGWKFYAWRQPGNIDQSVIDIGQRRFDPKEFWLVTQVDADREKINLTVWHPLYEVIPEKDRFTILFLFLDELLGEFGTDQWIGTIEFNPQRLGEAIPLQELLTLIQKTQAETNWKKFPPGECWTSYQVRKPANEFLRDDISTGTTLNMRLVEEYGAAKGELSDPLINTGADYVFITVDRAFFPKGSEVAVRGEIEDALTTALESGASGRILGGAFGTQFGYIDLLLFDGATSVEIITRVLREKKIPAGSSIHYFAKEKRGHRVVL